MARQQGTFNFSANLEPRVAAPLDARLVVPTLADLTNTSNWGAFYYAGMVVAVVNDSSADNNGVYVFLGGNIGSLSNWRRIDSTQGGGSVSLYQLLYFR